MNVDEALERIAELEAELAAEHEVQERGAKFLAEALAEVERLEAQDQVHWKTRRTLLAEVERLKTSMKEAWNDGYADGWDERGSGGRESGSGPRPVASGEPESSLAQAAANPAALIEPEFSRFIVAMRDKLMANLEKGDSWRWCDIAYLRDGVDQELAEADTNGSVGEWIDVANYVFFLAARKEAKA